MLAKMQRAQARVRIQEQLDGLSVDAEVKALDNVREHIKNTIAQANLGQGAGRVVARLAPRGAARAVRRRHRRAAARRDEGARPPRRRPPRRRCRRARRPPFEAEGAACCSPGLGRGAAAPLPARRGVSVRPPRQRVRPGRVRRQAAARAGVPDAEAAGREQGRRGGVQRVDGRQASSARKADLGGFDELLLLRERAKFLPAMERVLKTVQKVALIIEYAETRRARRRSGVPERRRPRRGGDAAPLVDGARDRGADNVVLLLAENLTELHPKLVSNPKVATVRVPMPDEATRGCA